MNRRYEVLLLTVPEVTQDETTNIERQIEKVIQNNKGTLQSFERWGKYKLVYPIGGNDYGVYFLARFDTSDAQKLLEELKSLFAVKLHEIVMRSIVSRLAEDAPSVYMRPKSLEESPMTRDVNTFLKENKMEGLLPTSGEKVPAVDQEPIEVDVPKDLAQSASTSE